MKSPISVGFVALCVNGSLRHQAVGVVLTIGVRKTSSMVVVRFGTHLPRAGSVRTADINGVGQRVCLVMTGRYMKIGM